VERRWARRGVSTVSHVVNVVNAVTWENGANAQHAGNAGNVAHCSRPSVTVTWRVDVHAGEKSWLCERWDRQTKENAGGVRVGARVSCVSFSESCD
jgi:hypothetical protein